MLVAILGLVFSRVTQLDSSTQTGLFEVKSVEERYWEVWQSHSHDQIQFAINDFMSKRSVKLEVSSHAQFFF